jgi:hypothetical protein
MVRVFGREVEKREKAGGCSLFFINLIDLLILNDSDLINLS